MVLNLSVGSMFQHFLTLAYHDFFDKYVEISTDGREQEIETTGKDYHFSSSASS